MIVVLWIQLIQCGVPPPPPPAGVDWCRLWWRAPCVAGEGDHGPEGLCTGQTLSGHHHTAQQVSAGTPETIPACIYYYNMQSSDTFHKCFSSYSCQCDMHVLEL